MNKKISTIFTMAALMGGSLFSSAYATDLATAAKDGGWYKIVRSAQYDNAKKAWSDVTAGNDDMYLTLDKDGNLTMSRSESQDNAWWKVAEGSIPGTYVLTNKAGKVLTYDNGVSKQTAFYSKNYKGVAAQGNSSDDAVSIDYQNGNGNLAMDYAGASATESPAGWNLSTADYQLLFNLVKVNDDTTTSEDFNKFFNDKGFTLKVKGDLDDIEVTGNPFGDSRVWACEITNPAGYEVATTEDNDGDGQPDKLIFPKGIYFFAERVMSGKYDGNTAAIAVDDIDWLNSTFIALSSTNSGEATDDDRKAGQGFLLTTVKGSDFLFDTNNPSAMEGTNIAVTNACFTAQSNYDDTYPFALAVENFWYQPAKKDMNKSKQEKVQVYLGVLSYDEERQNVASIPVKDEEVVIDKAEHIFGFSDSLIQDGRLLLNEDKTATVYTIKFVNVNEADKDLKDKYLTVGTNGSAFQWEAKGAAIADETFPAFQFLITNVAKANEDDAKYTIVTFTNRETNYSFKAKLYPEGEAGSNEYSMAIEGGNFEIYPFTVNRNTYAVEAQDQNSTATGIQGVQFDEDIVVKLNAVTPDKYAGFLNVDNKSIRTLAFARDINDTSNKVYAAVNAKKTTATLNANNKFATDIYDAAQWQLIKSEEPEAIARVFPYNNVADESADYVSVGDTLYAYTYKMRYVVDGTETNFYLADASKDLKYTDKEDEAQDFFIKENVDGSVSFFINASGYPVFDNANKQVAISTHRASFDVAYEEDNSTKLSWVTNATSTSIPMRPFIYESASKAGDIKTYLDPERVEVSWPAEEGHVTIASELGNYMSMSDERDAISVDETDATIFYLHVADKDAVVPSFFISEGMGGANAESERMFLFNPVDSVQYYVTKEGTYNKQYQARENVTKSIFKAGTLNETRDTLALTVKGEADKLVAMEADNNNKNVWGGLNRFKFQIVETEDMDGLYYIRQTKAGHADGEYKLDEDQSDFETLYLYVINNKFGWGPKSVAEKFVIKTAEAPTANESVSASEVKVIATDGAINIKNAAGKNVVISTILGQIVANEVLTSDNATISVPAGIAIVSVDGEEAVKVSVK